MRTEARAISAQAHGMVVAAHRMAAGAGAQVLAAGGNAADAAVATAAALGVVDPANCGMGGFGGFAVVHRPGSDPMQVAFNAAVAHSQQEPSGAPLRAPGARVTPPRVVAGLCALQKQFGRLGAGSVWEPAIALARDGFAVGQGLAQALRWAHANHRGLNAAFRQTFFRDGEALPEGTTLRQPRLAQTYERIAAEGAEALRSGALVSSIVETVNGAGGSLSAADFHGLEAQVARAAQGTYAAAKIWTADPSQCGASVLLSALQQLDREELGQASDERYVGALVSALRHAWQTREASYQRPSRAPNQTTHLCAGDADGMLVSMTFTHGPVWFGSGLLAESAGMVLNCGTHLHVRRTNDGAIVVQPHLTPVIVEHGETRYALGSPGGVRIPAIVLQAVVDLVSYAVPVERVWERARLSASPDGSLEAEAPWVEAFPQLNMRRLGLADFFGPAGALASTAQDIRAGLDGRFADAFAARAAEPAPTQSSERRPQ